MKRIPEDMLPGTRHMTNTCGELEVTEYINARNVHIEFVSTGSTSVCRGDHIREGRVRDNFLPSVYGVGYMGRGDFSYASATKIYNAWRGMFARCYSVSALTGRPTYIGCSVAPEWHNFQNFAEWYKVNYPKDGADYHLDKDIKIIGNKVYSPETCMFVTPAENTTAAHAKHYSFINPAKAQIEVYNLRAFCRDNGLSQSHMNEVYLGGRPHHKGWTKA